MLGVLAQQVMELQAHLALIQFFQLLHQQVEVVEDHKAVGMGVLKMVVLVEV